MLTVVLTVVFVLALVIHAVALMLLCRKCAAEYRVKEAWKIYALALETFMECDGDQEEIAATLGIRTAAYRKASQQSINAVDAAGLAVERLYEIGEYPDAYNPTAFCRR